MEGDWSLKRKGKRGDREAGRRGGEEKTEEEAADL